MQSIEVCGLNSQEEKSVTSAVSPALDSRRMDTPVGAQTGRWYTNYWLHLAMLCALVWACFGRTVSTYFLADDFGEIQYVARIFNGEPQLLWSNFVGNYMQIAGMNVWRPNLLMSLVFDWMLYKTQAWGWYLSNMLYFTGCVTLLYTVARRLTSSWSLERSSFAALLGAALFAASPLRCESVSWMVGRVDIVSCFYYLASFLFLLQAAQTGKKWPLILSVAAFWIGLLTKEMAVGLPVIAFAVGFFQLPRASGSSSVLARLKAGFILSLPFIISLAVYFALRMLFLGTLVGGYTAGFGASQMALMVQRWVDPDTLHRLVFPFNYGLIKEPNVYSNGLAVCYAVLLSLIGYRLLSGTLSWRWLAFLSIWAATTIAPIFQLWGLGYNLEGSRFYWFLSMPLCLCVPILLFCPQRQTGELTGEQQPATGKASALDLRLMGLGAVVLIAMIFVLGKVAFMTNALWVRAGKEVRMVADAAAAIAQQRPQAVHAVLGIPKDRFGAHLILNGGTFNTMISPPFTQEHLEKNFVTFDPVMFGPPEFVCATRLKATLAKPGVDLLLWSGKGRSFDRINLSAPSSGQTAPKPISMPIADLHDVWQPHTVGHASCSMKGASVRLEHVSEGDGLLFSGLKVNPCDYDFLEFDVRTSASQAGGKVRAQWTGSGAPSSEDASQLLSECVATASLRDEPSFQHVRVRLSHYWRWFVFSQINELVILPPAQDWVEFRNISLTSARAFVPTLAVSDVQEDNSGIFPVHEARLNLQVGQPAAAPSVIEIGKPNFFFDNFQFAALESYIGHELPLPAGQSSLSIAGDEFKKLFPVAGYYQIRARSTKPDATSEASDPITIRTF